VDISPAKTPDIKEVTLLISSNVIQDEDKENVKTDKLAISPVEKEFPLSILPVVIQNKEKLQTNNIAISAEEYLIVDATDDHIINSDEKNINKKEVKKVTMDQNITSKHNSETDEDRAVSKKAYKPYTQPSKPQRIMATFGQGNTHPVVPSNLLKTFNARAPLAEVYSLLKVLDLSRNLRARAQN
jgi:hypothetical protein